MKNSEWQPMATSPKEPLSRAIIYAPSLFPGESGVVGEAFLGRDGFWYWSGCEEGYHDPIYEGNSPPEKWMPLPDPPGETKNVDIRDYVDAGEGRI